MRVRFSPEALADAAAHRHLTAAFWACQDRGHDWWVDDPQALRGSAWLKAEGVAVREDIERLANASARRGRGSPVRTLTLDSLGASTDVAANGDVHAPADLGAQWLSRPLRIVVENAQCDGRLVRLVLLRTGSDAYVVGWATPSPTTSGPAGSRARATAKSSAWCTAGATPPPRKRPSAPCRPRVYRPAPS